jgi:plasmid stabilization system protein ParE
MVFEIKWAVRAENDFKNIVEYLEKNWSEKTAREYADKVNKVTQIIQKMPYLYPRISRRKNIRKCLVVKQNAMYFRIKKQTITILAIFDTRQHPAKMKF